jgi:hypothetical protein
MNCPNKCLDQPFSWIINWTDSSIFESPKDSPMGEFKIGINEIGRADFINSYRLIQDMEGGFRMFFTVSA